MAVPARIDDHEVARPDLRPRAFQVVRRDHLPLLLRDGDDDARPEEAFQWYLVHERCALDHVRGRVRVRRRVHESGYLLGENAGFGVVVKSLNLDVGEVGPERCAGPPGMAQVVEHKARPSGGPHRFWSGQGIQAHLSSRSAARYAVQSPAMQDSLEEESTDVNGVWQDLRGVKA